MEWFDFCFLNADIDEIQFSKQRAQRIRYSNPSFAQFLLKHQGLVFLHPSAETRSRAIVCIDRAAPDFVRDCLAVWHARARTARSEIRMIRGRESFSFLKLLCEFGDSVS